MRRPAPFLEIAMPPWLYARTHKVLGLTGLIVYRSIELRDTDPEYQPILDLLETEEHEVVSQVEVKDENMMFGQAEWTMYVLGGYSWAKMSRVTMTDVGNWADEMRSEFADSTGIGA